MPLYEYQCHECGVRFERRQSFNDMPIATCPECGGEVHRVIGATGVIFKGSGFYVTDNRKSSSTGNAAKPSPKSDESSTSSPSSDSSKSASTSSAND